MDYSVGQTVGDYQILEVLGAGGMGRVYKVRNLVSHRIEAMKVLLANLEDNPELRDRFLNEIRTLATLNHPHIAGLHTAQHLGDRVLMLMEFVEGDPLDRLMRSGRVPLADAVRYISQVLEALAYAHQRKIVHRDIKPPNILIDPKGNARLTDFGIALSAPDQRLTQAGHTVGSLHYMSPEQIQGVQNIDGRADLYSLGITLYELVTGKRPFQADSDFKVMAAHLHSQPVPPIEVDTQVPQMLSQVIMMAIAKEPGQRFQTADAMRTALQHALPQAEAATVAAEKTPARAAAPVKPQPAPAQPVAMKQGSSSRLLWLVAGSLVIVVVLVVAAIQLPFFHKTEAGQSTLTETPIPATPPSAPPPAVVETAPAPAPAPQSPPALQSPPAPQSPPALQPKRPATPQAAQRVQPTPSQPPASPQARTQPTPQARPPQAPAPQVQPPAAPAPARPSANSAAVAQQRERMIGIATRTGAVRSMLDRLRNTQARSGLGLRSDFVTAEQRLINFLDATDDALRAGDAAAAEKNLDSAEFPLRFLETNLGR